MSSPSVTTRAPRAPRTPRAPSVDAVCAAAVDLARAAAEEIADPGSVGEHEGVTADAERVVTHYFTCLSSAYRGWRWAVTVARAPRLKRVTVDESVLLPGPDALLAPEWLPWSERLRPGDLGVGDLLVTLPDDPRLEPGYAPLDSLDDLTDLTDLADLAGPGDPDLPGGDEDAAVAWELGLGRRRVLSRLGRDEAAERWYAGEQGPEAPIAAAAPGQCSTCGFFLQLAGSLRRVFGVCANEYAPDDGSVVSADHGCGAHSEAGAEAVAAGAVVAVSPVVDETGYDVFAMDGADDGAAEDIADAGAAEDIDGADAAADGDAAADAAADGAREGSVGPEEPAEELGHS